MIAAHIKGSIPNPWNHLTQCGYHVAYCDKTEILEINDKIEVKDKKFHLELWPEPFLGNPNAQVYLLNGNPGFTEGKDEKFVYDPVFQKLALNSLLHKSTPDYDDFLYFNKLKNVGGLTHPGYEWWMKHTKQLRQVLGRNPRLFNVEFCAYHSINANHIPEYLPSYDYTDQLVINAMNENKIIIAMRMVNRWMARIPQLKNYPNLYRLLNNRNVCLTSGNIIKAIHSFGSVFNAC